MYPFFAVKSPLVLYPFRFFDPIRGRWVRARYVAERHVIAAQYDRWEIFGPPEIRSRTSTGSFNPFRPPVTHLHPVEEPPPGHGPTPDPPPVEQPPPIEDQLERFLVLLFLRRYVHVVRKVPQIRTDERRGAAVRGGQVRAMMDRSHCN